ncbi:F-box domain protein [Aspergillus luchuensis]|uniref:F-box domain protein n=1 Tax=Aspergillus kawachii TaxID=1069201 RepID=A0A146FXA3_ASPKA|nr:F-box domain protein [Aspergillus luchuensis]
MLQNGKAEGTTCEETSSDPQGLESTGSVKPVPLGKDTKGSSLVRKVVSIDIE